MHLCVSNFNTSHVNVNPYRAELLPDFAVISIHLMLMLIVRILFLYFYQVHFNTHLMLMLIKGAWATSEFQKGFQYISC